MSKLITEVLSLSKLALQVALSQLAIIGMGTTDVLLVGRASTGELAALSLGNNIWNIVILFFFGIGSITQALVGRFYGANDIDGLRGQLHQSIWLTLGLGVMGTLSIVMAATLLMDAGFEAGMASRANDYLLAIAWGAIPMTMLPALRGSLEAMSLTRAVLWINLSIFIINIPLDYFLIYGIYGFPQLGAEGCAWATALLLWLGLFANLAMLNWHHSIRHLSVFRHFQWPQWQRIRDTFILGLPIGFSVLIEMSMFSGAGMLIAYFGPTATSAHSVAISIASASFMIYLGIGQGITIRASQQLGSGDNKGAVYSIKVGVILSMCLAFLITVCFLLLRNQLAGLYTQDSAVVDLAVTLLLFGAVFQLFDCLQAVCICALRAYHDTASSAKYQAFAYWMVGLPVGILLGFYLDIPGLSDALGLWFAMVLSLSISSTLIARRLWQFRTESKTLKA
ncbi:MAG: MATE family efflux transporter [Pseudomonadota bacterium]|nr:MATE family efflux transporter [Pseudomonadota bacterium]